MSSDEDMKMLTAMTMPVFVDGSDGMVVSRRSDGRWNISMPPESRAFGTANNVAGLVKFPSPWLLGEDGPWLGLIKVIEKAQKLSALTGRE